MANNEQQQPRPDATDSALGAEIRQRLSSQIERAKTFSGPDSQPLSTAKPSSVGAWWNPLSRISRLEIAVFLRQFATLFSIGIPVLRALQILSKRVGSYRLRAVIRMVGRDVEEGKSLSEALSRHPRVFTGFIVSSIRAGELGGTMSETLNLLADYLEKDNRMRRRVRSALNYPIIVSCTAIVIVIWMLLKVFPSFVAVYKVENVQLPLPTRILLGIQSFLMSEGFFLLALIAVVIIVYNVLKQSVNWAQWFDRIKLRIPIYGSHLETRIVSYRFARLTSVMINSGVPVHQALEIAADALGNAAVKRKLKRANTLISHGESIELALRQEKVFPDLLHDIIGVGEQTGALEQVLTRTADAYEEELAATFDNLSVVLEPLMLLAVGGLVALIALAMFLPYYNLGGVLLPH